MKLRTFATTLATAAALTLAAPAWAGYVFSFSVAPDPVYKGDAVSVNVSLVNDASDGLNALGFDLLFDPSVLDFQSATRGTLNAGWDFLADGSTAGIVSVLSSDLLLMDAFGDGTVATLAFTASEVGSSPLTIDSLFLSSDTAYLDGRDPAGASTSPGGVTVQAPVTNGVPAPATLALASLGLALLAGTRRRGCPRLAAG